MQVARTAFAVVAWLFVAVVTLQVFFAGLGLFGSEGMDLHIGFGYLVPLVALAVPIAALAARAGARTTWLSGGLVLLTFVQTSLPYFRGDLPAIAALHPVNALLIFWIGLAIARRAAALARTPRAPTAEAEASAETAGA
jgi:Family of unknown function (DUF6220)